MKIAVLGHFSKYSTETQISDTLEYLMGYDVARISEDPYEEERFIEESKGCRLVILIGSHGRRADTLFHTLHKDGIYTAALHLDKFINIPGRSNLQGWQFQTQRQFTADPEITLPSHTWLPPAISEHYCFAGIPSPEWSCDVAFAGSVSAYHKEYPFRRRLVDWLHACYGDRFIHIGDEVKLHGRDLNDFYASANAVVGDWFLSGTPRYWSDRAPETCGRFGFLLAPKTEGLAYPGLATYSPQDLYSLQRQIDYWLEHDNKRRERAQSIAEHVKKNHTYTQRMKTVLRCMNLS